MTNNSSKLWLANDGTTAAMVLEVKTAEQINLNTDIKESLQLN